MDFPEPAVIALRIPSVVWLSGREFAIPRRSLLNDGGSHTPPVPPSPVAAASPVLRMKDQGECGDTLDAQLSDNRRHPRLRVSLDLGADQGIRRAVMPH